VLFDERIVYSQCIGCNGNPPMGKGGNYIEYFVFMEKEWGREKIDEFRELKHTIKIYKEADFKEIEEIYKEKTRKLLTI
jgi:Bacteriophage Lambda NinG protein